MICSLYAVHVPLCVFAKSFSFFFQRIQARNALGILPVVGGCILTAAALHLAVKRYSLRLASWLRFNQSQPEQMCAQDGKP
jgi:hypothetical protein